MLDLLDHLQVSLDTRYAIQREIGHGGMAVVYLAEDRRHERTVALKVLQPHFSEVLGADRFLREIKVAARMHHPIDTGTNHLSFRCVVRPVVGDVGGHPRDDQTR